MERRSRFFGALAGVGLVLGVPGYRIQKELEQVEQGARLVLDSARVGSPEGLPFDQAAPDVVKVLYNRQASYGRVKEYKVESVNTLPYGPSEVRGLVKREDRWFRFYMKGNYAGRPFDYGEEEALFSE